MRMEFTTLLERIVNRTGSFTADDLRREDPLRPLDIDALLACMQRHALIEPQVAGRLMNATFVGDASQNQIATFRVTSRAAWDAREALDDKSIASHPRTTSFRSALRPRSPSVGEWLGEGRYRTIRDRAWQHRDAVQRARHSDARGGCAEGL